MRYDLPALARKTGFEPRLLESVLRMCDILQDMSRVPYLGNRLALYGGTALNFIHFDGLPRLSFDLDFNYRQPPGADWGAERAHIDDLLKRQLGRLGYGEIRIQPTYPLVRMDLKFRDESGLGGHLKIETGYLRRIPILRRDSTARFNHIGTGEKIPILTPRKEELFANKVATFLKRGKARDLFDVYNIAGCRFDRESFDLCLAVECLICGIDPEETGLAGRNVPAGADRELRAIVRDGRLSTNLAGTAVAFIDGALKRVAESYGDLFSVFEEAGTIDLASLKGDKRIVNPLLASHPAILWALERRRKRR